MSSSMTSLTDFLAKVLSTEQEMAAALQYQRERLPGLLANIGEVPAAHERALRRLVSEKRGRS